MITVGVPTLRPTAHVASSLGEVIRELNVTVDWEVGNQYIHEAKNSIVQRFMESDSKTLVFVDDDLNFTAEDFKKILVPGSVVFGVYRRKIELVFYPVLLKDEEYKTDEYGRLPARRGQGGFMKIEKDVFNKIPAREYARFTKKKEYFPLELVEYEGNLTWEGEDYGFCRKCEEAGIDMWCVPDIDFGHVGSKVYQGRFSDVLKPV